MFNNKKQSVLTALSLSALISYGAVSTYSYEKKIDDLDDKVTDLSKDNKKKDIELDKKDIEVKVLSEEKKEQDKKYKELEEKVKKQAAELAKVEKAKHDTREYAKKNGTPMQMTVSYYGDGAEENGGYAGITAYGEKLRSGMVASNVYPKGTKFTWHGQTYTVSDKGGSHFNSYNRLDVFVPRKSGESDDAYARRISKYGKHTVTAYKH